MEKTGKLVNMLVALDLAVFGGGVAVGVGVRQSQEADDRERRAMLIADAAIQRDERLRVHEARIARLKKVGEQALAVAEAARSVIASREHRYSTNAERALAISAAHSQFDAVSNRYMLAFTELNSSEGPMNECRSGLTAAADLTESSSLIQARSYLDDVLFYCTDVSAYVAVVTRSES